MAAAGVAFETGHAEMVHDAQLDYYGQRLATASSDSLVKIFDVSKEDQLVQLAELRGHDGPVWQVSWAHPSFGRLLASVSYDCRVIVWKETGQPQNDDPNQSQWSKVFQDSSHQASLTSVAWAPHSYGLVLAVGSADGSVSVISHNPQTQQWHRLSFAAHKGGVNSVCWGPDVRTGALVLSNPNPASGGAPAGSVRPPLRLLTAGCDGQLQIWQWQAEEGCWRAQRDLWVGGDNRHGSAQPNARNAAEAAAAGSFGGDADMVRDAQWAPGLGLPRGAIASCADDGSVVVWNEQPNGQWKKKWRRRMPGGPVWRLSWSPMGNVLAVSQGDNQVSLWKEVGEGDWKHINAVGGANAAPLGPQKQQPQPLPVPSVAAAVAGASTPPAPRSALSNTPPQMQQPQPLAQQPARPSQQVHQQGPPGPQARSAMAPTGGFAQSQPQPQLVSPAGGGMNGYAFPQPQPQLAVGPGARHLPPAMPNYHPGPAAPGARPFPGQF